MSKLSTYPTATIADGDKIPFTDDPAGTPATKNALAEAIAEYMFVKSSAYCALYTVAGSQAGLTATPALFTAWLAVLEENDLVGSHVNDEITVATDGIYEASLVISFSGTSNKTFTFYIYKNAAPSGIQFERKLGTGGDTGSASCVGPISLVATDTVKVYVKSADGGTDIASCVGTLNLKRIG